MNSIKLEWKRGDWAAYFGLMTNNLTNLLTMMGLLIFVVGILPKLSMVALRLPLVWRCWWPASATPGLACRWQNTPGVKT